MGNTSTQSKQLWNARHYTQIKISVKPETASAFKEACRLSGVSMASVLSQHMDQYSSNPAVKKGYAQDLDSRGQRRAAIGSLVKQLERIRDNEERYGDNIPDNLKGSVVFERAEESVSLMNEAIELLEAAY